MKNQVKSNRERSQNKPAQQPEKNASKNIRAQNPKDSVETIRNHTDEKHDNDYHPKEHKSTQANKKGNTRTAPGRNS